VWSGFVDLVVVSDPTYLKRRVAASQLLTVMSKLSISVVESL
jgi:hypothetical protein